MLTWEQRRVACGPAELLQRGPAGPQAQQAQGLGHAQGGEDHVVLLRPRLQLVQPRPEGGRRVLGGLRLPATVARWQEGEEEERGQEVQGGHLRRLNVEGGGEATHTHKVTPARPRYPRLPRATCRSGPFILAASFRLDATFARTRLDAPLPRQLPS